MRGAEAGLAEFRKPDGARCVRIVWSQEVAVCCEAPKEKGGGLCREVYGHDNIDMFRALNLKNAPPQSWFQEDREIYSDLDSQRNPVDGMAVIGLKKTLQPGRRAESQKERTGRTPLGVGVGMDRTRH